ncbi:hypothetical protein ABK040_013289 [Willaertia magna]
MSEEEINNNLEKMLDSIGAKEEVKIITRKNTLVNKYQMVKTWMENQKQLSNEQSEDSIPKLMFKLKNKDIQALKDISVTLRNNPVSWVERFIDTGGIKLLNEILATTNLLKQSKNKDDDTIQWDCLTCFKAILNTEKGLTEMMNEKQVFLNMVLLLDSDKIEVRINTLFILAMIISGCETVEGFKIVQSSLEHFKLIRREKQMFEFIINSVRNSPFLDIDYLTHILFLFNSLLTGSDGTENVTIANQLNSVKAIDAFKEAIKGKDVDDEGFTNQFSMFVEEMEQALQKDIRDVDTSNPVSMTERLRLKLYGTETLDSLIKILRHLLVFTDVFSDKFTINEIIDLWKQIELTVEKIIREKTNPNENLNTNSPVSTTTLNLSENGTMVLSPLLKKLKHGKSFIHLKPNQYDHRNDVSSELDDSVDEDFSEKSTISTTAPSSSVAEEAILKKLRAHEEIIDKLTTELKVKQEKLEKLQNIEKTSKVQVEVEKEKFTKELERLQSKISVLESENQTLQQLTKILEETKSKLNKKVTSLNEKVEQTRIKVIEQAEVIAQQQITIKEKEDTLIEKEENFVKREKELTEALKLAELSNKPQENSMGNEEELRKLREKAFSLEGNISQLKTEMQKWKQQAEKAEENITTHKQRIKELEEELQREKEKKISSATSTAPINVPPPPTGNIPMPPVTTGTIPTPPGVNNIPTPPGTGTIPMPPTSGIPTPPGMGIPTPPGTIPMPPGGGIPSPPGTIPMPPGTGIPTPPGGGGIPMPPGMTGVPMPPGTGVPMPPGMNMPPPPMGIRPPVMNPTANLPKLPTMTPKAKLRAFHFEAVPIKNVSETIFVKQKIVEQTHTIIKDINISEFEEMFEIKSNNNLPIGGGSTTQKEKITLIDPKRSYNISLQLGSLRGITYPQLKEAILQMDETVVTPLNISTIKQIVPTEEEAQTCFDYEGDKDDLQATDLFFIEMHGIPRMVERCECWEFKMKFNESVNSIRPVIKTVRNACEELKTCDKFHTLLGIILTLGNYLNASGKKLQHAFRMKSLAKLNDTKSANGKTSLLTFIVKLVQEKYPDIEDFASELSNVSASTRVLVGALQDEIRQCQSSLSKVEAQVDKALQDDLQGDQFASIMKGFLEEGLESIKEIDTNFNEMMKDIKSLSPLFNEPEADLSKEPDKFFQQIDQFIKLFNEAREKLKKERDIEEKKKKQQEKQKEVRKSVTMNALSRNSRSMSISNSPVSPGTKQTSPTPKSPTTEGGRSDFDKKGAALLKNAKLLRERKNARKQSAQLDDVL